MIFHRWKVVAGEIVRGWKPGTSIPVQMKENHGRQMASPEGEVCTLWGDLIGLEASSVEGDGCRRACTNYLKGREEGKVMYVRKTNV